MVVKCCLQTVVKSGLMANMFCISIFNCKIQRKSKIEQILFLNLLLNCHIVKE